MTHRGGPLALRAAVAALAGIVMNIWLRGSSHGREEAWVTGSFRVKKYATANKHR